MSAVLYLHTNGIAHLDLKPPNGEFRRCCIIIFILFFCVCIFKNNHYFFPTVLIDASGRTKLCDLGQSKFTGRASLAKGGVGTVDYMPPEALVFDGSAGYIDEKKWDVYSCGIMFWYRYNEVLVMTQMSTPYKYFRWLWHDEPPFSGRNMFAVADAVREGQRPKWKPGNYPTVLVEFVARCWHHSPAERPTVRVRPFFCFSLVS